MRRESSSTIERIASPIFVDGHRTQRLSADSAQTFCSPAIARVRCAASTSFDAVMDIDEIMKILPHRCGRHS